MTAPRLRRLTEGGVSLWLDGISRFLLSSGALAALVRNWQVTGVTSTPGLLAHAVRTGHSYAGQIDDLAGRAVPADRAVWEIKDRDIRSACDVLGSVHRARRGTDGLVSVDIDPRLTGDEAATVELARELWRRVDRPNLLIEIPPTGAGLAAITRCLAEGISVNATPVFSPERYQQVADAHLAGLELARRAGLPLPPIQCVASFHVAPIDGAVDPLLDGIGTATARALRGRTALAAAWLTLERHTATYTSARWQEQARHGARPQRLLWSELAVRDPAYRDTHYIDGLCAPATACAMSEQLLWSVADHSRIVAAAVSDEQRGRAARETLESLRALGIALPGLTAALERSAHEESSATWHQLLDAVRLRLEKSG